MAEYDEMEGIAWEWQSADSASREAPLAQEPVGPNPTDVEKNGSKRHIQVDESGVPLSLLVSAANPHDSTKLEALLQAKVILAPKETVENLCLDAGYIRKDTVLLKQAISLIFGHEEKKSVKSREIQTLNPEDRSLN